MHPADLVAVFVMLCAAIWICHRRDMKMACKKVTLETTIKVKAETTGRMLDQFEKEFAQARSDLKTVDFFTVEALVDSLRVAGLTDDQISRVLFSVKTELDLNFSTMDGGQYLIDEIAQENFDHAREIDRCKEEIEARSDVISSNDARVTEIQGVIALIPKDETEEPAEETPDEEAAAESPDEGQPTPDEPAPTPPAEETPPAGETPVPLLCSGDGPPELVTPDSAPAATPTETPPPPATSEPICHC
ncbi:MAG: hypothetical protein WC797_03380 [Candidatus Paceibacterota bacterium]|jgi:hypothetical protein